MPVRDMYVHIYGLDTMDSVYLAESGREMSKSRISLNTTLLLQRKIERAKVLTLIGLELPKEFQFFKQRAIPIHKNKKICEFCECVIICIIFSFLQ